jgi:DNA-binding PadR family transcriptional regulator
MTDADVPPRERLRQLVNGYQVTQAIHVAVVLGVPDLLADGPRSASNLAAETGSHPGSLYRLLRALTSVGVLRTSGEDDDRQFELTELGHLVRNDVPGSLAGWVMLVGRPYHWEAWGDLLHSVQTGQTAFDARHDGESVWAWREQRPEESRIFDRAMSSIAATVARGLADRYDFDGCSVVADLGGGEGTLLATILPRYPDMKGLLLDLPHVVSGAPGVLAAAGVADRCEIVPGSFFESVPSGCDAYVLKSILHDWDDAASVQILRQIHEATSATSRVLIVERIVNDREPSAIAAMSDLNMMVNTGGQERSIEHWRALTDAAKFELTRTIDIGFGWSVIETTRSPDQHAGT